jgi:hypothetical protein
VARSHRGVGRGRQLRTGRRQAGRDASRGSWPSHARRGPRPSSLPMQLSPKPLPGAPVKALSHGVEEPPVYVLDGKGRTRRRKAPAHPDVGTRPSSIAIPGLAQRPTSVPSRCSARRWFPKRAHGRDRRPEAANGVACSSPAAPTQAVRTQPGTRFGAAIPDPRPLGRAHRTVHRRSQRSARTRVVPTSRRGRAPRRYSPKGPSARRRRSRSGLGRSYPHRSSRSSPDPRRGAFVAPQPARLCAEADARPRRTHP